jgi:striatin 1/3/4
MNTNDNLYPSNSNELIKNFSDMVLNFEKRQLDWKKSKEVYEKKIFELSKKIKTHENINTDLLKRVKMLEYEIQRQKEFKKNGKNKNDLLFKDTQYKNIIKDDDLSLIDDFGSSNQSSIINILKNIGINERLANNLFIDFELNKPELEALIKKDIEQKFLENDINSINIKEDPNEKKNLSFTKYAELNSHFDEVRKLSYIENMNCLISVSEDCLIKVWDLNNIMYNSQNEDITPYLNLRGHTGPLFCVEHGKDNLIYSGGNEGLIRIWNILPPTEINSYSSNDELINLNLGYFQNNEENEMYWDLKHHPKENILVSLSSYANITFWETTSAEEFVQSFNQGKSKWSKSNKYKKSCYKNDENAIPICCEFMKQNNDKLVIGFNDDTLSLLDINKNTFISHYNLFNYNYYKKINNKNINRVLLQPNCLVCYNSIPCVFAGCEDSTIKLFDFRNNIPSTLISNAYSKEIITDSIKGHDDAVTSLNLYKDLYLFSTSHDEKIKLWDIRKLKEPIDTISTSQKKWDESIWHSLLIEKSLTLCVACADSTIKLYKL